MSLPSIIKSTSQRIFNSASKSTGKNSTFAEIFLKVVKAVGRGSLQVACCNATEENVKWAKSRIGAAIQRNFKSAATPEPESKTP